MKNIIVNIAALFLLVGLLILILCLTKVINCGGTSKDDASPSTEQDEMSSSTGGSLPDCNSRGLYKAGGCDCRKNCGGSGCLTAFGKSKNGVYTYCGGGDGLCFEGAQCDFGYTTKCKGVKGKDDTVCSNFNAADCESDARCTCGDQKCTDFPGKAFCSVDGTNKALKKCKS